MIPKGMALQKSLSKKEGQMLFTGAGPKPQPKALGEEKKTRKREKKGSNNLATFGIRINPSIEDLLEEN